jgi:outer membrane usher protein
MVRLCAVVLAIASLSLVSKAASPNPASPEAGKLNSTGRTIQLPVPLKDGDTVLGEVNLRIDALDVIRLSTAQLGELLKGTLDGEGLVRLARLGGEVTLDELRAGGLAFDFNRSLLELHFSPDLDQRGETELSLGGYRKRAESSVAIAPAFYSGYLNLLLGVDHLWQSGQGNIDGSETGFRLDTQGAMRVGDLVIENDAVYQGAVDPFICPIDAYCVYQHEEGFKRRATRIVYDRPEDRVRVQLGDADTLATGMQNSPALLGMSIEKSYRKLAPGDNVRPTGSQSFQLVRPSQVDVIVNGTLLRRFDLRPGSYNLQDLPLGIGGNDVELVITDDTGGRESIRFTQYFDHNLLAAGKSEWAVAGGVTSLLLDNEREYREGDYFGTAFLRYGLSNELTAETNIQADARVLMGGFGVFRATAWGAFGLEASVSGGTSGIGYAVSGSWSLSNFEGPLSVLTGLEDSLYATAIYQRGLPQAGRIPPDCRRHRLSELSVFLAHFTELRDNAGAQSHGDVVWSIPTRGGRLQRPLSL